MGRDVLSAVEMAGFLTNEESAVAHFESIRWPDGPVCPHCGSQGAYRIKANPKRRVRHGLLKCKDCKKQFTVRVGTVFEGSNVPLGKWLYAIHQLCSSKKGISALQLSRNLGVGYRTAWFMCHRIRHAMTEGTMGAMLTGTVEVDETYVGGKPRNGDKEHKKFTSDKTPAMVLVERGGRARSMPLERVDASTLKGEIRNHIHPSATINTDEHQSYTGIGKEFAGGHHITTNAAEGFCSLLKRGHYGVYHQMSKRHLHRYCDEFAFRWNLRDVPDSERTAALIMAAAGKRLKYSDRALSQP